MIKDLNKIFIENGVYQLRLDGSVFVCTRSCGTDIGKLTKYNNFGENAYEKTNLCYFLNDYPEGDIKSIFVERENYDMIGIIGSNFILRDKYLIKE